MYKICKTCKRSDFGVIRRKTEEKAARLINGEISEYFDGSYEVHEELLYNYCFTCSKEITEDDLEEINTCSICKKEVSDLNANSVCKECARKAEKLSNISKEDLILMLLKQSEEGLPKSVKLNQTVKSEKLNKIIKSDVIDELSELKEKTDICTISDKGNILKDKKDICVISDEVKKVNELKDKTYMPDTSAKTKEFNKDSNLASRSSTPKAHNIKKLEKSSKEKLKNNQKSDTIDSIKEAQMKTDLQKVEIDNEKKSKLKGSCRANNRSATNKRKKPEEESYKESKIKKGKEDNMVLQGSATDNHIKNSKDNTILKDVADNHIKNKKDNMILQDDTDNLINENKGNIIFQDTIDNAINDNKEKIKSIYKRKDLDFGNFEYVADEINDAIQDIKDASFNLNATEEDNLFTIEVRENNIVDDTLSEIEGIINNAFTIKYEDCN